MDGIEFVHGNIIINVIGHNYRWNLVFFFFNINFFVLFFWVYKLYGLAVRDFNLFFVFNL